MRIIIHIHIHTVVRRHAQPPRGFRTPVDAATCTVSKKCVQLHSSAPKYPRTRVALPARRALEACTNFATSQPQSVFQVFRLDTHTPKYPTYKRP